MALELLAEWYGETADALPAEAGQVVAECGRLPLALAMVGAMLRGSPGRWGKVLHKLRTADLAKISRQFPNYPYPDLLRAMAVSVDALNPQARQRYLDCAVFPENGAVPESVLVTFWEPLGLDPYDVQDLIDLFVERSLTRRDPQGRLSLHALQLDYVRQELGDLPALHRRLLFAYQRRLPSGAWLLLEDDGYIFRYLTWTRAGGAV
jgi:hypothetical protein